MKPISAKNILPMQVECARCFSALGLQPRLADAEFDTECLRVLHEYTDNPDEQRDIEIALSAEGKTVEPGEDEENYRTGFYKQLERHFLRPIQLLIARTDNILDVTASNHAIDDARKMLMTLHQRLQQQDLRQVTEAALKEFDAATLIARSDDLTITREKAHQLLQKGR